MNQPRVNLTPPQSRPFALIIRSQIATGPLPVEQKVGLISVEGAAGQVVKGRAGGREAAAVSRDQEGCTKVQCHTIGHGAAFVCGGDMAVTKGGCGNQRLLLTIKILDRGAGDQDKLV